MRYNKKDGLNTVFHSPQPYNGNNNCRLNMPQVHANLTTIPDEFLRTEKASLRTERQPDKKKKDSFVVFPGNKREKEQSSSLINLDNNNNNSNSNKNAILNAAHSNPTKPTPVRAVSA
jgi:hypothetical protein